MSIWASRAEVERDGRELAVAAAVREEDLVRLGKAQHAAQRAARVRNDGSELGRAMRHGHHRRAGALKVEELGLDFCHHSHWQRRRSRREVGQWRARSRRADGALNRGVQGSHCTDTFRSGCNV